MLLSTACVLGQTAATAVCTAHAYLVVAVSRRSQQSADLQAEHQSHQSGLIDSAPAAYARGCQNADSNASSEASLQQ
jgi:hypothetical protein